MEYTREALDRSTGELIVESIGEFLTITEIGQHYGVGARRVRAVLAKMELLHPEESGEHSRYRLAKWAVDQGLGMRHERRGKFPFDVISPAGQAWIGEKWEGTLQELEDAKGSVVLTARTALEAFQIERDQFRSQHGAEPMATQELVRWLSFHFPALTQNQIAEAVDVSQPLVARILSRRDSQRAQLRANRNVPLS